MNNYIVRTYIDVIVITKFATRRASKAQSIDYSTCIKTKNISKCINNNINKNLHCSDIKPLHSRIYKQHNLLLVNCIAISLRLVWRQITSSTPNSVILSHSTPDSRSTIIYLHKRIGFKHILLSYLT